MKIKEALLKIIEKMPDEHINTIELEIKTGYHLISVNTAGYDDRLTIKITSSEEIL